MTISSFLSIFLALGALAVGQDVSSAQSCLSSISNLAVLTSSSPNYATASQPYNRRMSPSPDIIVSP